jgi:hypothetical protein
LPPEIAAHVLSKQHSWLLAQLTRCVKLLLESRLIHDPAGLSIVHACSYGFEETLLLPNPVILTRGEKNSGRPAILGNYNRSIQVFQVTSCIGFEFSEGNDTLGNTYIFHKASWAMFSLNIAHI